MNSQAINDKWMDGPKDKFETALYNWYLLYYVNDDGMVQKEKVVPARFFIMHMIRECVDDNGCLHKQLFQWLLRMKKKESQIVSNIIYFTTNLINDTESAYYQTSTPLMGEELFKSMKIEVDNFGDDLSYKDYLEFKNHAETDVFDQAEAAKLPIVETTPKGKATARASSFSRMDLKKRIEDVEAGRKGERKVLAVKRRLEFDPASPSYIEWGFSFPGVRKFKCPDVSSSVGHLNMVFSDPSDGKRKWFDFNGHIGNYGNDGWKAKRNRVDLAITELMTALGEMVEDGQELV